MTRSRVARATGGFVRHARLAPDTDVDQYPFSLPVVRWLSRVGGLDVHCVVITMNNLVLIRSISSSGTSPIMLPEVLTFDRRDYPRVHRTLFTVREAEPGLADEALAAADALGLSERKVRTAVRYYAAYRQDIDDRITANREAAQEAEAA
jgi:hypothetical protein